MISALPHNLTVEQLLELPQQELRSLLESFDDKAALKLLYEWSFWARPLQLPPDYQEWFVWLLLGGRGVGKTRSGGEWVRHRVESGTGRRIALVGETVADVRDVMIHGESGLLNICPPWNRPTYEPSKRLLMWPNGAIALTFSGEDPEQLRGPQFDTAWVDELAKYRQADEIWSNLEFGLRLGRPQVVVTTTPRPIKLLKEMLDDPQVRVVTESTYANLANLSERFIDRVIRKYEGTRLGEQELHARMLSDVQGALWTLDMLDVTRAPRPPMVFERVVIGVDPAMSSEEDSDETGIVAVGKTDSKHGYVLDDWSGTYTPKEWPKKVVELYRKYGASCIVVEKNAGGELVEFALRQTDGGESLPLRMVWAKQGKHVRAEPIALLYERGLMHNVGRFDRMEEQLRATTRDGYIGTGSPDRMDAMVYAALELFEHGGEYDARKWGTLKVA